MKICIYTANFEGYDRLQSPQCSCANADFISFISQGDDEQPFPWQSVRTNYIEGHKQLTVKHIKMLPYLYLEDYQNYDFIVWIDASMTWMLDPSKLYEIIPKKAELVCFRHPSRSCVYKEINQCRKSKLDSEESLNKAEFWLKHEMHYPENGGLHQGGIIIRKPTKLVESFNAFWWYYTVLYTMRDQITLPIAVRNSNVPFKRLGSNIKKQFIRMHKHVKRRPKAK